MSLLPYGAALREFQVRYYAEVMVAAGGSVTRAAALAGRNRTEFYRALAKVGLKPADFRALARAPESGIVPLAAVPPMGAAKT